MKLTLKQEKGAEKEIVVRCDQVDDEIRSLMEALAIRERRLQVFRGGEMRLLVPAEVLYCESVDGKTFVYTAADMYTARTSLAQIAGHFVENGFFRCSKSMVVNLRAMDSLKSGDNGRILATLANGERILVSRQYARQLRDMLKGGID